MADIKETIPFDFDSLYTSLQTKFADKGYDIAEGSNTSQLVTAMTYLTSMLNMNTAVNINETILPLARKLDNAKQAARMLGYEVAHKQSYKYQLTLTLAAGNHIIPKYSEFTADGKKYYYMGTQLEFTNVPNGYQIQIDVKEGTLYKFADNTSTLTLTTTNTTDAAGNTIPQYYIDIPFVDVENDGLEVFLTYYDTNGNLYTREQWKETKQFMIDKDTVLKKQFVRMDDISFHTPRIYFELAGVGQGVRPGTIVEINALTTSGTSGGVADITDPSVFKVPASIDGTCAGVILLLQGTDEEGLDSIKENAPLFHNSANRAITKDDYTSICNRHQTVKTSMVWGGDDEFPKSPGHIWFTFLPSSNIRTFTNDEFYTNYTLNTPSDLVNWYIENGEIRSTDYTIDGQQINPGIWDVLDNYKIPTLEFHNRHPIYLDFKYDIEILKYNIRTSKAAIHQEMFGILDDCFTGLNDVIVLEDFETEYFHSNIEKRIDQSLTDVAGFNNTLTTKLMITHKNISAEVVNIANRDIFIPMAVPYETYFDNNDDLITSKLPNIDTNNFADVYNLYVDWTNVNGKKTDKIIVAPIRVSQTETKTGITGKVVNLSKIDFGSMFASFNAVANHLVVKVNGTTVTYTLTGEQQVTLTNAITPTATVTVSLDGFAGRYYLFNDYRKYIIAHLYINAEGYDAASTTENGLSSEAKSYLTSVDGYYGYTTDDYYITTEGYVMQYPSDTDINTGSTVGLISGGEYQTSPLKFQNFVDVTAYLNFNYASHNFKVIKNVIPRLREVTFK